MAAPTSTTGTRTATALHHYRGLNCIFQKVRYRLDPPEEGRDKTFRYRWRHGPGYVWVPGKPPGADEYIYNLPAVYEAVRVGEAVYICEGEKDAEALIERGYVATTAHQGAGKFTAQQAQWFRGHTGKVVLLYDLDADDERGGNMGTLDLVLRYDRLRAVGLTASQLCIYHAAVGKDISDHLAAGRRMRDLVHVPKITTNMRAKAKATRASAVRAYRSKAGAP